MTFAELLASEDPGIAWLLEVSFNDFVSVAYRWSTASYRDASGNTYDGRIASLTQVSRGFGHDHLPAAATVRLVIDNSDFGADWLIDRTTVASQVLQARFRLSPLLYDRTSYAGAAALTSATTPLCIYTCLDQPELADNTITLTLADDSLGRLAEPLTTPTVRDWFDADPTTPFLTGSPAAGMDWDVPLPIVFGLGEGQVAVPAYKAVAQYFDDRTVTVTYATLYGSPPYGATKTFPLIVCVSRAGNYLGTDEITRLQGTFTAQVSGRPEFSKSTIEIPRAFRLPTAPGQPGSAYTVADADDPTARTVWTPRRSLEFTKSGRAWQVVYIDFNVDVYAQWFIAAFPDLRLTPNGGQAVDSNLLPTASADRNDQGNRGSLLGAFASFRCAGSPLSVVTTRQIPTAEDEVGASLRLIDFIKDAIAYYSKATLADIDTAAFERAAKARASVWGAGIIQPSRPKPQESQERYGWVSPNPQDGVLGVLRAALGEMCGSCDADLFMTKEGLYSISTTVFDYEAVTGDRTDVDETRIRGVRVRTPSAGERWAPYNRVMLVGPGGVSFGPYDNQVAIDAWGRTLPITLMAKWNARLTGSDPSISADTVWNYRTLESRVRPLIRFEASREYVDFELGDYFTFTWSRGGQSSVFDGTIFRVESLRIDPGSLLVEVEAVWADDLATEQPYLLDDEELLLVADDVDGFRTVDVLDGSPSIGFSSGSLDADGVEDGDILILLDSTQTQDVFTRHRAMRIESHDDTSVVVAESDLDFDAPGGATVSTWEIRKGATTYPDSSSDPTNYPDDGEMYGKACDVNDNYSDSGFPTNLLKDG